LLSNYVYVFFFINCFGLIFFIINILFLCFYRSID
jgi:hypothetical protein